MALPTSKQGAPTTRTKQLRAIQTHFNGHHFRSRLEARWAVFFTELGISYEYEPEGFELPSGARYLPDFYLPELSTWFEVKGSEPNRNSSDYKKWREFAELMAGENHDGPRAVLAWGQLPDPARLDESGHPTPNWPKGQNQFDIEVANDYHYAWCYCWDCDELGIEFDARGDRVCDHDHGGDKGYSGNDPRILQAYARARSARFEYGETPRT